MKNCEKRLKTVKKDEKRRKNSESGKKTTKTAKNAGKTAKNCEKLRSFFCPGYRTAAQLHEVNQPWLHSRPPSSSPWSWIWTWTRWPWVEVAREGEQVHRCQDIKVCPLSFSTPSYHWSNYVANHNVCTYFTLLSLSFYLSFCMHALHCPPDSPSYRPPCLPPTFFPPPPPTHSCRAQLHSKSPPARMHHISHLLHHLHILLFFPSNIMLHNNACVTLPTCLKSPRPSCIPLISHCPPPPTPSRHTQLHWTSPAPRLLQQLLVRVIVQVSNHLLLLAQHPFQHIPIKESENIVHIDLYFHDALQRSGSFSWCCSSLVWFGLVAAVTAYMKTVECMYI